MIAPADLGTTRPTLSPPPRPRCFGSYTCISEQCKTCSTWRTACVDASKVVRSPQIIGSATVRVEKDGKFYVQVNVGKTQVNATVSVHKTPR